jgi:predicted phage terminase large subunit-like protein
VADLLVDDEVDEAVFESNKGGRGFGRNVERLLKERSSRRCVIRDQPQTANNEARILASSAWVAKHVFMPPNWKHKYPEFYRQLANHQRKGRNAHDDAPDVLAAIYERVANPKKSTFRVRHA